MEEQHPAPRGERGGGEGGGAPGEPVAEDRDRRDARDREEGGEQAHLVEPAARVRDDPGEQEVERCPSALGEDDVEGAAQGVAADEERQGLVLVRGPLVELDEEEDRDRAR